MKNLLLTAVAALGFAYATLAQVPNYVPTNGLVGWWPFNGNANDESGNGNNGTVNGATLTTDRNGNANSAYDFNGSSITVIDDQSIGANLTSAHTINVWATIQSFPSGFVPLVSKDGPVYHQYELFLEPQLVGYWSTNIYSSAPTPNWNIDQWYMITATFDSGLIMYYINGVDTFSTISTTLLNVSNSSILEFGADSPNGIQYHDGKLDDIGIWNRALTQEEITNLYNGNICFETVTVTDTLLINMGIVGYNPITYSNTIKIFPNPSNDHITIDYGDFASLNGYQLRIDNSLGQQMFQSAINQQTSYISLSTWTGNGLYFVHIIDSQGNTIDIRKIVLQ